MTTPTPERLHEVADTLTSFAQLLVLTLREHEAIAFAAEALHDQADRYEAVPIISAPPPGTNPEWKGD